MAPPSPKGAGNTDADALIGETVGGRYRIDAQLGQGGMGMVYRATHVGLDKAVALKFIVDKYSSDGDVVQRFHREAKAASRIGHDNIIDITDIGTTEDGRHFIAMELLQGKDLSELLELDGAFAAPRALRLIRQVLYGLQAAHEKGIVHRDMKPENVFVVRHPQHGEKAKIMDFGISKIIDHHEAQVRLTETGAVIGTPIYMAPEQAHADPSMDHRVDIYAVGVMLYELLAGRPPFVAPTYLALVTKHISEEPPPLTEFRPDLPPELVQAVHRALAKDPAQRFQSAADFARALPDEGEVERALSMQHTIPAVTKELNSQRPAAVAMAPTAYAETGLSQLPKRSKKGPVIAATLLLLAGAAAGAVALSGGEEPKPSAAAAHRGEDQPSPSSLAADDRSAGDTSSETPSPADPELGALDLKSAPTGARVYLDGRDKGITPASLESLPVGEHHLRFSLEGHKEIEMVVELYAGQRTLLHKELSPLPAGSDSGSKKSGGASSGKSKPRSPDPGKAKPASSTDKTPSTDKAQSDTKAGVPKPGNNQSNGKRPGGKKPGGKKNPYLR